MKTFLKFAAAGAALASAAAHATMALPTDSGGGDLMLVVQDTALTNVSYTRDTGITLNSLFPSSVIPSTYTGPVTVNDQSSPISVGADANLQSFLSQHSADLAAGKIQWALEAGAYNGALSASALSAVGAARFLTTENPTLSAAQQLSNLTGTVTSTITGSWTHLTGDINNDNAFGAANNTALGASDKSTVIGTTAATTGDGIWGTSNGLSANQSWYTTSGIDQTQAFMTSTSSTQSLYGVTGNGTKTSKAQVYLFGNWSLDANGNLHNNPVATPLPAAVWLFGSGLVGLLGLGRRRVAV